MADAGDAPDGTAATLGIGEVVAALADRFPGVTASKLRFLEEQGLVRPERTAAGYRRFSERDVDRVRLVLVLQREQFLPLKVIREQLDALDRGERPADLPAAPRLSADSDSARLAEGLAGPARRWTRAELAREAGVAEDLLAQLEQYSLLVPDEQGTVGASGLAVVRAAAMLAAHGLEPRHLRPLRAAADRELGLVERAVAPLASRRDAETRARTARTAREIADAARRLQAALVAEGLEQWDE